jgi:glycosyltransferase involved in cell wall biosynthesis
MLDQGIDSQIISYLGDIESEKVKYIGKKNSILDIFSRVIFKIFNYILIKDQKYSFFPDWNVGLLSVKSIYRNLLFDPEIIMVYWSKYFFDSKTIYKLSKRFNARVIFVYMDMAVITGGCHYSHDCMSFTEQCGNCPSLRFKNRFDLSYRTFKKKEKYFRLINPIITYAGSESKSQIESSSLFSSSQKMFFKPLVNSDFFFPFNSHNELLRVREKYGIDKNKRIYLFAAAYINERRKGFNLLIDAINIMTSREQGIFNGSQFIFIGENLPVVDSNIDYIHFAYQEDTSKLAELIRCADIFLNLSTEDAGPLILYFAIKSGLPVISFRAGSALDLVADKINGYLVREKDAESLSRVLSESIALKEDEINRFSQNSYKTGLEILDPQKIIKDLFSVFNELKK